MRVGEILHRDGIVSAEDLASALADQSIANKRVCSLLIVRGVLEPDQAARALAEQFGVSAALTRHLDNRDPALAKLMPANIARQHCALVLGRLRDGEIVICVRDPKPNTQAAFERLLQKPVLVTVAAAHTIEPLIDMTYPVAATQDYGVRFARPSTNPSTLYAQQQQRPPTAPPSFASGTVRSAQHAPPADDVEVDLDDGPTPTIPETFALVDLDDAGVAKDFSQADMKTPTTLPPGFGVTRQPTLPPANATRTPDKK